MISKREIVNSYVRKCEEFNRPQNKAVFNYLDQQRQQQEQNIAAREEREEAGDEAAEEDDMFFMDEDNNLDFIFMGNDKYNFNSRIDDLDLMPVASVLEPHAIFIEHIDLRYNRITDTGAISLSKVLRAAANLQTLNLQSNLISEDGADSVADALEAHDSLQYINLNGNKIRTPGAKKIIALLRTNPKLVELDIGDNEIDHDGIINLTTVLNETNNTLQILNADKPLFNSVMQETAVHLAQMLTVNQGIQKISLRKFRLRCDGIYTICEHLMENSTLRVLDLSCNEIAVEGAQALAKFLTGEYCGLESLHLSANRIVDLGAKALAQAIAQNQTLIHIDLTHNNITDDGLSRVAESLFHNKTLLSFKLYGNHFAQGCLQLYHKLFQTARENEWYPDFNTYIVDDEVQMAYVETNTPYDIYI